MNYVYVYIRLYGGYLSLEIIKITKKMTTILYD